MVVPFTKSASAVNTTRSAFRDRKRSKKLLGKFYNSRDGSIPEHRKNVQATFSPLKPVSKRRSKSPNISNTYSQQSFNTSIVCVVSEGRDEINPGPLQEEIEVTFLPEIREEFNPTSVEPNKEIDKNDGTQGLTSYLYAIDENNGISREKGTSPIRTSLFSRVANLKRVISNLGDLPKEIKKSCSIISNDNEINPAPSKCDNYKMKRAKSVKCTAMFSGEADKTRRKSKPPGYHKGQSINNNIKSYGHSANRIPRTIYSGKTGEVEISSRNTVMFSRVTKKKKLKRNSSNHQRGKKDKDSIKTRSHLPSHTDASSCLFEDASKSINNDFFLEAPPESLDISIKYAANIEKLEGNLPSFIEEIELTDMTKWRSKDFLQTSAHNKGTEKTCDAINRRKNAKLSTKPTTIVNSMIQNSNQMNCKNTNKNDADISVNNFCEKGNDKNASIKSPIGAVGVNSNCPNNDSHFKNPNSFALRNYIKTVGLKEEIEVTSMDKVGTAYASPSNVNILIIQKLKSKGDSIRKKLLAPPMVAEKKEKIELLNDQKQPKQDKNGLVDTIKCLWLKESSDLIATRSVSTIGAIHDVPKLGDGGRETDTKENLMSVKDTVSVNAIAQRPETNSNDIKECLKKKRNTSHEESFKKEKSNAANDNEQTSQAFKTISKKTIEQTELTQGMQITFTKVLDIDHGHHNLEQVEVKMCANLDRSFIIEEDTQLDKLEQPNFHDSQNNPVMMNDEDRKEKITSLKTLGGIKNLQEASLETNSYDKINLQSRLVQNPPNNPVIMDEDRKEKLTPLKTFGGIINLQEASLEPSSYDKAYLRPRLAQKKEKKTMKKLMENILNNSLTKDTLHKSLQMFGYSHSDSVSVSSSYSSPVNDLAVDTNKTSAKENSIEICKGHSSSDAFDSAHGKELSLKQVELSKDRDAFGDITLNGIMTKNCIDTKDANGVPKSDVNESCGVEPTEYNTNCIEKPRKLALNKIDQNLELSFIEMYDAIENIVKSSTKEDCKNDVIRRCANYARANTSDLIGLHDISCNALSISCSVNSIPNKDSLVSHIFGLHHICDSGDKSSTAKNGKNCEKLLVEDKKRSFECTKKEEQKQANKQTPSIYTLNNTEPEEMTNTTEDISPKDISINKDGRLDINEAKHKNNKLENMNEPNQVGNIAKSDHLYLSSNMGGISNQSQDEYICKEQKSVVVSAVNDGSRFVHSANGKKEPSETRTSKLKFINNKDANSEQKRDMDSLDKMQVSAQASKSKTCKSTENNNNDDSCLSDGSPYELSNNRIKCGDSDKNKDSCVKSKISTNIDATSNNRELRENNKKIEDHNSGKGSSQILKDSAKNHGEKKGKPKLNDKSDVSYLSFGSPDELSKNRITCEGSSAKSKIPTSNNIELLENKKIEDHNSEKGDFQILKHSRNNHARNASDSLDEVNPVNFVEENISITPTKGIHSLISVQRSVNMPRNDEKAFDYPPSTKGGKTLFKLKEQLSFNDASTVLTVDSVCLEDLEYSHNFESMTPAKLNEQLSFNDASTVLSVDSGCSYNNKLLSSIGDESAAIPLSSLSLNSGSATHSFSTKDSYSNFVNSESYDSIDSGETSNSNHTFDISMKSDSCSSDITGKTFSTVNSSLYPTNSDSYVSYETEDFFDNGKPRSINYAVASDSHMESFCSNVTDEFLDDSTSRSANSADAFETFSSLESFGVTNNKYDDDVKDFVRNIFSEKLEPTGTHNASNDDISFDIAEDGFSLSELGSFSDVHISKHKYFGANDKLRIYKRK